MQTSIMQRSTARSCRTLRGSSKSSAPKPQRHMSIRAATEESVDASANGAIKTTTPTAPLDFDELSGVLKLVHETDIVELELKSSKFNLTVRKREALKVETVQVVQAAPAAPVPPPMFSLPPPPAPSAPAPPPAAAPAPPPAPAPPAPAAVSGVEVASPMAGTFYACPAPGEPAFVKEGDTVTKGQTIGIVEAMKMMNEIEADVSGTIVKILVKSGDSVSSGQPILVIKA